MLGDLFRHGMFPTDFPFEGKQHGATAITDFVSFGSSRMGANQEGPFFGLVMSPAAREVFGAFELGGPSVALSLDLPGIRFCVLCSLYQTIVSGAANEGALRWLKKGVENER